MSTEMLNAFLLFFYGFALLAVVLLLICATCDAHDREVAEWLGMPLHVFRSYKWKDVCKFRRDYQKWLCETRKKRK